MKRSFWLKHIFVVLLGLSALGSAVSASQPISTLLVMGDSLSDAYRLPKEVGWVEQLADRLKPHTQVINASISGETSAGGALRLPSLLKDHEPDVVIIILGGNDGLRALHPDQLKEHLSAMIEQAKAAQAMVGLMQVRLPPNLGPAYIQRFEAVYPQLAAEYGLNLMPFFLEDFFDQEGMLMDDGIHPTADAQGLMFESIWPHVEALMASAHGEGSETSAMQSTSEQK